MLIRKSYRPFVMAAVLALVWTSSCIAQSTASAPSWPHAIKLNGADVVVYQPQAIDWQNHARLVARAAIAVTQQGANSPVLGTIDVSLATRTEAGTDMVDLSDPQLLSSHFPSLDTTQAEAFETQIRRGLPEMQTRRIPLKAVLLSLEQKQQAANAPLQNDPPVIFYSDRPASLVVFDGEPVLAPVGKTGLSFAVNTNWNMFTDGKAWYLLNNGLWLSAHGYDGPFQPVTHLPAAFSHIPADRNFADVRKSIPPRYGKPSAVPTIFVSTRPAEIIVTEGAPQFAPVPGTGLQVVKNSNSALFLLPSTGAFYLQLSGRWFSAHGLNGPWSFASDKLPADFSLLPANGPQGALLASVPGTSEAELAVLQAQVPQQAALKKSAAKATVTYAGPPRFKPIPGTTLLYAVNTSYEVIEASHKFYLCYQGAWFVAASPTGPWLLAASVPQVIYTIPPSSPVYNVTYVKVYGVTPATVTYGYTSGYMMGFVTAGVLVYGTGYYYPPVVIPGAVPIYYPYPYSYVGNAWYNPSTGAWAHGGTVYGPYGGAARGGTYYNPTTGAWARGGAVYGPYGGVGAFSAYNPTTGAYAHGSAAWGPDGGSAHANYYNPRTGISGSTNQNWNPYSRWGSSTISGPNQTVNTASGNNARGSAGGFSSSTGAKGGGYSTASGNRGGAVKTQGGDTYAGHDGNVYRHTSDGWSKWNSGGWQPVNPPSSNRLQSGHGGSTGNTLGSTQANRQYAPGQRQTGSQTRGGAYQPIDRSTYQQLERDRQARFSGTQQRFGAERGRGEFSGGFGGRFRR